MNPIIIYYKNGNKRYEYFVKDLRHFHNENGPAHIMYYENGNKFSESYFIIGKYHNIKGPSYIEYCEYGKITLKEYYLNGEFINVNSDKELLKYIKRLNIS